LDRDLNAAKVPGTDVMGSQGLQNDELEEVRQQAIFPPHFIER
jgi:hypothetical protein